MQKDLIEHHGVIGNMRSAALVSISGSIDFFCFPAFDSPSVFASLIDGKQGGEFRLEARMEGLRTRQLYLPDTNILLTRFLSPDGVAEVTDFMPITDAGMLAPYANQIIRVVRAVHGTVEFKLRCAPRFDYGRAKHEACQEGSGVCFRPKTADGRPHDGLTAVALYASIPLEVDGGDAVAMFTLNAGESVCLAFGDVAKEETSAEELLKPERVEAQFENTTRFWREWMGQSRYTGHWRETVNRSALVLKLLTSADYGSVAAAVTFGLPERKGGARNWDYRYSWLRDSAFAMYAFMRLGFRKEARAFTLWMRDRLIEGLEKQGEGEAPGSRNDGPLSIMYKLDGGAVTEEVELDHFAGYADARPVRIGNGAVSQMQLDIYGEIMDAVYLANKYVTGISNDGWRRIRRILNWLADNWEREDEGIWEVRNGRKHFLHSRLMCWVAFDRGIRLADKRSLVAPLEEWRKCRDAIHEDILDNFWDEELGAFTQAKGEKGIDASVLLMPLLRFISPTDPRWQRTMKVIEEKLSEDALVFRYLSGTDGLDGQEGSFTACCFWRIEALARAGEVDRARLLFEKMLGYANHLGLYAEELGRDGEQLGNFPQVLTHLALISAATYLDRKLSHPHGGDTWE